MSANCDVIVISLIFGQFGAIWELDSGRIVRKTYISVNSNLLFYKKCKQNYVCVHTHVPNFKFLAYF